MEAGGDSAGCGSADVTAPLLLDVPEYKDFERAYPPPAGATKLAMHCETVLTRVKTLFKPVHATAPSRSASRDVEPAPSGPRPRSASRERASGSSRPRSASSRGAGPQPPLKPVLPPKLPSTAAPPAAMPREPRAADGPMEPSCPEAPSSSARDAVVRKSLQDPQLTLILAQKSRRSRSEPGPPRCALPPLPRGSSPRRRLSSEEGNSGGSSGPVQTHTPVKQAIPRAVLQLKAVDIIL